jgi:hypothetical protein
VNQIPSLFTLVEVIVVVRRNSNKTWRKYSAEVDRGLYRKVDWTLKADGMSSWLTRSKLNGFSHGGEEGGIEQV